jgi:uncharacterized membrane protein
MSDCEFCVQRKKVQKLFLIIFGVMVGGLIASSYLRYFGKSIELFGISLTISAVLLCVWQFIKEQKALDAIEKRMREPHRHTD